MSPILELGGLTHAHRNALTTVGIAASTPGVDAVLLRSDEVHALLLGAMALIACANQSLQEEMTT